ncbi:SMARCC1.2 family protein [Megaselia abdita]
MNQDVIHHEEIVYADDIPVIEEVVVNEEEPLTVAVPEPESDQLLETACFETVSSGGELKYIGPRSARSLLKVQFAPVSIPPPSKFKSTLSVHPETLKGKGSNVLRVKSLLKSPAKANHQKHTKFKETIKISSASLRNVNELVYKKVAKVVTARGTRKISDSFGENITISHDMKDCMERDLSDTFVRLTRVEDSDVEVDIESTDESQETPPIPPSPVKPLTRIPNCLKEVSIPKKEISVDREYVSDLEKYIHSEFFDGRPTKTPEQYLRIRNHILDKWEKYKPIYVSKTSVRSGLKHGGDVNCISRIHRLLEQIGAINFGYQGQYFEYVRPLKEYMSMFVQIPRKRAHFDDGSPEKVNFRREKVRCGF